MRFWKQRVQYLEEETTAMARVKTYSYRDEVTQKICEGIAEKTGLILLKEAVDICEHTLTIRRFECCKYSFSPHVLYEPDKEGVTFGVMLHTSLGDENRSDAITWGHKSLTTIEDDLDKIIDEIITRMDETTAMELRK
jgi:hypothetical protein